MHSPSDHPVLARRRFLLTSLAAGSAAALAACGGGNGEAMGELATSAARTSAVKLKPKTNDEWRIPAETELQAAIMFSAPTVDYKQGWSMRDVQAEMIKRLLPTVDIEYFVNTDDSDNPVENDVKAISALLVAKGVKSEQMQRITFRKVPHADLWMRDTGGMVMVGPNDQKKVADFDFDGYNYIPFAGPATRDVYNFDNDMSVRVAQALGLPVERAGVITEGGNLVFSGEGTVIGTETAGFKRNPGMTRQQFEAEMARALNVKQFIWLPRGLATDAHTVLQTPYMVGGTPVYNVGVNHSDEMVAWVDERTVLLPEVSDAELRAAQAEGDPTVAISHEVLEQCAAILGQARTASGKNIKVIRVPDPGTIIIDINPDDVIWQFIADLDAHPSVRLQGAERFRNGEPVKFMLPASYMNFLVANNVVLIPKFYKVGRNPLLAQKDEQFRKTIVKCYPGRQVHQIDVDALVVGGGGMHCITQHRPA